LKVTWSPDAAAELKRRYGDQKTDWRLVYDTEGCGCAVNGVPALWAISHPERDDIPAFGQPFTLWYDPHHAVFFDDELRIAFDPVKQSFSLFSDGQIYTTRLLIADRRSGIPVSGIRT
jgi:uncharacterized protein YqkB